MSTTRHPLVLAVALPLVAGVLASCNDGSNLVAGPTPGSGGTTEPATAEPTSPTTTAPAPGPATTAPAPSGTRAVAVYYVADTTNGPRLYREFHRRAATTAVVRDAVTAMLDQAPLDPDYTSLWADGTRVRGVSKDGATLVVDLTKLATTAGGGAEFEDATLQQLVWTATAADPSSTAVRLLVEGKRVESLWGHVDTSQPMRRGQAASELGAVWVLTPTQGGTVRRGGTFGGEASVFEATVSWQLLQGTKVVAKGFANASAGAPARGTWSAKADVPAGDYVLRAFESSAKDGSDTFVDDKRIRVV
jgi:hypothetical protein